MGHGLTDSDAIVCITELVSVGVVQADSEPDESASAEEVEQRAMRG